MQVGVFDHGMVLVLLVLVPVAGLQEHDRMVSAVRRGNADARLRTYRSTLAKEWGITLLVLALWLLSGRSLAALGLAGDSGWLAWLGWGLALVAIAALVAQAILVPRSPSALEALRRQMRDLQELVPHDGRESRFFAAVSVTAGICEELVYRGFLLAYLQSLFGLWAAVVLSSVVFGLGHAYQGTRGILKTAAVGVAMALLLVLTGGVWAPMLVHATIDLTSGHMARRALQNWQPTPA